MNRRPRLPGADELFRSTGGSTRQTAALAEAAGAEVTELSRHPGRSGRADVTGPEPAEPTASASDAGWDESTPPAAAPAPVRAVRLGRRGGESRPTGRERHDEKITVYCSPEELLQLEHARLTLRAAHGLAVDRGRIVREAVAVVLADLEAKGEASILVRRLRGR